MSVFNITFYISSCIITHIRWESKVLLYSILSEGLQQALWVILVPLVISRSDIRRSVGTSDATVISSTKTEAHNLGSTNASAVQRDGSFFGSVELFYCQKLKRCSTFLIYNDVHYHIPSVVIFQKWKGKQTEMTDAPSGDRSRERD